VNRDKLERRQIPIYLIAVMLAAAFGLLAPQTAQGLAAWVTPAIAVLMYAMFLQIPFLELRQGLDDKRYMGALLCANFILVPLLVWGLTRGLVDHPAILVGALLVLLTPCIDYVVVFTHIGKGDSRLILAATPLLLVLQLILLPLYLALMLEDGGAMSVSAGPFIEAFVLLIVLPMGLAVLTCAGARRSRLLARWSGGWAWLPVPAMAAVLVVVIGSQIAFVWQQLDSLLPVLSVYVGFLVLAPAAGALVARGFGLSAGKARSVVFSSSTRNSLVVLPLALALPEDIRGLAAAAVITQTLVELLGELLYIRIVPALVWGRRSDRSPRNGLGDHSSQA